MTLAFHAAMLPNQKNPVPLKDLLVDVNASTKRKQSWQEVKAALQIALAPEGQ